MTQKLNTIEGLAAIVAAGVGAGLWTVTEARDDSYEKAGPNVYLLDAGTDGQSHPLFLMAGGYANPGRVVATLDSFRVLGKRVPACDVLRHREPAPAATVGASRDPLKAAKEIHRKLVADPVAADVVDRMRKRVATLLNNFAALMAHTEQLKPLGFEFPDLNPDRNSYSVNAYRTPACGMVDSLEVYARGDARVTLTVPVERVADLLAAIRGSTVTEA